MKKRNCIFSVKLVFFIVLAVFAAGCKTTQKVPEEPELPAVDTLSVLDSDSAVYFRVPAASHKDFVKSLILSSVNTISDSDADLITNHLDTVYAGLGTSEDPSRIQISASGNIPSIAVKAALNEKHGWTVHTAPSVFYTRQGTDWQLALPSKKNILLAKNVQPLVDNYTRLKAGESSEIMQENIRTWMTENTVDIRFCVLHPQAFLARLIGIDMRLALVYAEGTLVESGDDFMLTLELAFQKPQVVKAAQAMLTLAFGKGITAEYQDGSNILTVSGIRISKRQVLDLMLQ